MALRSRCFPEYFVLKSLPHLYSSLVLRAVKKERRIDSPLIAIIEDKLAVRKLLDEAQDKSS
jgi:hypothetical protein